MEQIRLAIEKRGDIGKGAARKIRRDGYTPGILYGPETEAFPISVKTLELAALFRTHGHASKLIDLDMEGDEKPRKALIREIQRDPVTGQYRHIDIYQVSLSKKLHLSTRLRLTGTPAGVKLGGILEHIIREIEIACLPDDIPDKIEVDVSHLDIGDSIHVSDIAVDKVDILTNPKRTIATVVPPTVVKAAAEEAAAAAPAAEEAAEEAPAEGEPEETATKKETTPQKKE
jgi:large subunit ribosomal protein L25